jgi:hypothetical protein
VLGNMGLPQWLENPVLVDCVNRLRHRYRSCASIARTRIECQREPKRALFIAA